MWAWFTLISGDKAPQFQTISVQPQTMRFVGGQVRVRAQVIDDTRLNWVRGVVLQEGSQHLQLSAQKPSGNSRELTFLAEFRAPANTRSDGAAIEYSVRLVAADSAGHETVETVSFQVAAPAAPPPPPQ
jgi:hypothetical protein